MSLAATLDCRAHSFTWRKAIHREVNGMEMGEVTVIESAPEATVKAVEVPPPPVEGTPNPVRAEGEMI